MTFEEKWGPIPCDTYGMALWQTARAAWMQGQEAMRFRCRQIAGAASLIPVPGTGDANHVGEVVYDSNAAKIARDIDALPVE